MAIPSRRHRMIESLIKQQEAEKKKYVKKEDEDKVSVEEHKRRLKLLKDMGIIKED